MFFWFQKENKMAAFITAISKGANELSFASTTSCVLMATAIIVLGAVAFIVSNKKEAN